jgi:sugar lactone lactonase YvrE
MAVSPTGDRLVVSEWRGKRVATFRIDPRDGSLSHRSVLRELGDGGTDGLCLDESGAVWCASPMDGQCVRISPKGEITDTARPLTGHHVMACVLGGADRRTLFMMTNRRPAPSSGTIEAVRVDVPGAGRP